MKINLAILGAGVVASMVGYVVWHKYHKKKHTAGINNDNNRLTESVYMGADKIIEDEKTIKSKMTSNMLSRHKDVAQIMQDAVENICKRSEVPETQNKELDIISDELDTLI